jgi:hypothetical protein
MTLKTAISPCVSLLAIQADAPEGPLGQNETLGFCVF